MILIVDSLKQLISEGLRSIRMLDITTNSDCEWSTVASSEVVGMSAKIYNAYVLSVS